MSGIEFQPEMFVRESPLLREATLWLSERAFIWRNNTGVARHPVTGQVVRFGIKGGSDLLAVVPPFGRFLGVETKAKRGRQSAAQSVFERAVRRVGGVYALARTMEDVYRVFEEAARIPNAEVREAFARIAERFCADLDKGDDWIGCAHAIVDAIRARAA